MSKVSGAMTLSKFGKELARAFGRRKDGKPWSGIGK